MISRWMRDDVLTAVQSLVPIAADLGLTMAQLAIAWVLANPNVSAAIVGASRPEQIVDNAKASGVLLPGDVLAAIDEALAAVVTSDPALTTSPRPRP
jgi:aryl-alcohol dehydrogenase-like predicted oxidoreductase